MVLFSTLALYLGHDWITAKFALNGTDGFMQIAISFVHLVDKYDARNFSIGFFIVPVSLTPYCQCLSLRVKNFFERGQEVPSCVKPSFRGLRSIE